MLSGVVALEIPARPEFVGIVRMAVAALAGLRTGFSYERIDDLRIVVSEACTTAIEAVAGGGDPDVRLRLRCIDDPEGLTITIAGPPGTFDGWLADPGADELRIALMSALVDEAGANDSGEELRLVVMRRDDGADDD